MIITFLQLVEKIFGIIRVIFIMLAIYYFAFLSWTGSDKWNTYPLDVNLPIRPIICNRASYVLVYAHWIRITLFVKSKVVFTVSSPQSWDTTESTVKIKAYLNLRQILMAMDNCNSLVLIRNLLLILIH